MKEGKKKYFFDNLKKDTRPRIFPVSFFVSTSVRRTEMKTWRRYGKLSSVTWRLEGFAIGVKDTTLCLKILY